MTTHRDLLKERDGRRTEQEKSTENRTDQSQEKRIREEDNGEPLFLSPSLPFLRLSLLSCFRSTFKVQTLGRAVSPKTGEGEARVSLCTYAAHRLENTSWSS